MSNSGLIQLCRNRGV